MKQADLFDFMKEDDPLYKMLLDLKINESIKLSDDIIITLNENGLYELSSDDLHEARKDLNCFYFFLKEIENKKILKN